MAEEFFEDVMEEDECVSNSSPQDILHEDLQRAFEKEPSKRNAEKLAIYIRLRNKYLELEAENQVLRKKLGGGDERERKKPKPEEKKPSEKPKPEEKKPSELVTSNGSGPRMAMTRAVKQRDGSKCVITEVDSEAQTCTASHVVAIKQIKAAIDNDPDKIFSKHPGVLDKIKLYIKDLPKQDPWYDPKTSILLLGKGKYWDLWFNNWLFYVKDDRKTIVCSNELLKDKDFIEEMKRFGGKPPAQLRMPKDEKEWPSKLAFEIHREYAMNYIPSKGKKQKRTWPK